MKYYVVSKDLFANGARMWVASRAQAHCFGDDLEAAKHHASTFSDPSAQAELVALGHRELPGHTDARALGYFDE